MWTPPRGIPESLRYEQMAYGWGRPKEKTRYNRRDRKKCTEGATVSKGGCCPTQGDAEKEPLVKKNAKTNREQENVRKESPQKNINIGGERWEVGQSEMFQNEKSEQGARQR